MKIVPYYRIRRKGPNKADEPNKVPMPQRTAIREFARANDATIVQSFVEMEDGPMADRPKLRAAIRKAQSAKAKLVIADRYRVIRDKLFLAILHETSVDCACIGDPRIKPDLMAIHLQFEGMSRESASVNTKNSLADAKASGVKLGSARPGHWKGREHLRGSKQAAKASGKARSDRAYEAYAPLILPTIKRMKAEGATDEAIAAKLNDEGHTTTAGKPFTYVAVYRLRVRYLNKKSRDAA